MRRCFIPGLLADEMILSGQDARHIVHVLRHKVGDELIVADAAGKAASARIVETGEDWIKIVRLAEIEECTEPPVDVVLAQCLPKSDKMDFIVQKATELGVSAVCPVVSENCVVKYDENKKAARRQKWQKIAHEAAKQCGRAIVPEILPVISLRELAGAAGEGRQMLFCYEQETSCALKELLTAAQSNRFLLLIGPEGGFSQAEARLCRGQGFKSVSLGPRILRAETASLAAVSIVMYQNGDLGGRR